MLLQEIQTPTQDNIVILEFLHLRLHFLQGSSDTVHVFSDFRQGVTHGLPNLGLKQILIGLQSGKEVIHCLLIPFQDTLAKLLDIRDNLLLICPQDIQI